MSRTAFQIGLYEEHCEELAGLYELRHARLDAWDTTPDDLAELEARVEAHIDALVLGEAVALAVVAAQPVANDPASLYTQLALAGRVQAFALVEPALNALTALCGDPSVEARDAAFACRAAADALCHHAPPAWNDALVAVLAQALPHAAPVFAAFIGHARLAHGGDLLHALARQPDVDLVGVLWAAARVPDADIHRLLVHLDDPRPDVARAAAIAALWRDPRAATNALAQRWPAPWTVIPLALSAGPGLARRIHVAAADTPTPENLLALGLLGDPASIDLLFSHLSADGLAEIAALALFLISGAAVRGEPPESVDIDGDGDEEINTSPIPLSGFDLSTNPETWSRWLHGHRPRLIAGVRHRFGAPVTPAGDLHALATVAAPRVLRRWLADELVIRHGVDCGYEVDAWTTVQARALAAAKPPATPPGTWTRHGRTASP